MKWVKASERLPDVIHFPMTKGVDKGSNRIHFKYDGEAYAGRYVEQKWQIKDVFVSAEMETPIPRSFFHLIEWLDES
jgi:hypothetical protein